MDIGLGPGLARHDATQTPRPNPKALDQGHPAGCGGAGGGGALEPSGFGAALL